MKPKNIFKFGVGAAALACTPSIQAQDKPNIILVMADDLGHGDVAYNGHKVIRTPEIDRMAKECTVLANFYSAAPVCSPTRATCLTGRHHFRTGVTDHSKAINPDELTVADVLGKNGYLTGLFGKWHLHGSRGYKWAKEHAPFMPDKLGFHEWFATGNNTEKVDPDYYWENGKQLKKQKGEDSAIVMDKALAFIKKAKAENKPFMAFIWFHTPHTPYGSTPEFLDMYKSEKKKKTQEYYAQITAMDKQVGRLRDELKKLGIAKNTLLIFTSDNGAKEPGSNAPFPGKKGKTSEGGNHVPGIVEWPAKMQHPGKIDTPMVTTDFYPTFLAAVGVEDPGPKRNMDGENMLPALLGDKNFKRKNPIRFYYRKRGGTVTTDGKWIKKVKEDPGFDPWLKSIQEDCSKSLKIIEEKKQTK